jgi:hypothetical protein
VAAIPSIRSRLFTTPMRDLMRLRLTGRLAWQQHLRELGLPSEVQSLIERVVRRARLWRLEQVDVAEELLSHFAEGADSGASAAELVGHFGDERIAARLIRRAKMRNRPWFWKVIRWLPGVIVVLLLYYGILAIQFYTGRPTIKMDYFSEANRAVEQTPTDQRAWPIYRQAMLDMGISDPHFPTKQYESDHNEQKLQQWVDVHSAAMSLIRQAAAKPVLGFALGPNGSGADPQLNPTQKPDPWPGSPNAAPVRLLAMLLAADAASASAHHDGDRFVADVLAIWQMSDQFSTCPNQPLIHYLVGMAFAQSLSTRWTGCSFSRRDCSTKRNYGTSATSWQFRRRLQTCSISTASGW